MLVTLPLLFMMKNIDFENPMILNGARAGFFVMLVLQFGIAMYLKNSVPKNPTKIFIKPAPQPFQPPSNEYTEHTYGEYEQEKAGELLKQSLIGSAISTFIHFKFGVNQVVVMQCVMIPMNLYDNPIVKKYILGSKERVWGEKLAGEKLDDSNVASTTDVKKAEKESLPAKMGDAIVAMWNDTTADFDSFLPRALKEPNAASDSDKWTPLMVAAGSPSETTKFIKAMLANKATDVLKTDNDGWTALHWSAFHDRPVAAETLLGNAKDADKLLAIKDSEGKTALEVAQQEGNTKVVSIIEQFSGSASKDDDSTVRQRKAKETSMDEQD